VQSLPLMSVISTEQETRRTTAKGRTLWTEEPGDIAVLSPTADLGMNYEDNSILLQ